jgi:uncharacterized protein YkwD
MSIPYMACLRPILLTLALALPLGLTSCEALSEIVEPSPSVTVSLEPGGNGAAPLEDAILYGEVFIHAETDTLEEVRVYFDDRERSEAPYGVLSESPFRLSLDTHILHDGPHTLTLELTLTDGQTTLSHVPFTVHNVAGDMLGFVNAARALGHDCGSEGTFGSAAALRLEARLIAAAQKHAEDMDEHDYFSHTGQDGSLPSERVTREGYSWSKVGENLAQRYPDAAKTVDAWLESDGHCANLMNPDYSETGVGQSGDYWVQVFARPQ